MAARRVRTRVVGTYAERIAEFDASGVIGDWFPYGADSDLPHPLQLATDLTTRHTSPVRLKDAQVAYLLKQCQRRARTGKQASKASEAAKAEALFNVCSGPKLRGFYAKTALLSVYAAAGLFKPAMALYGSIRAEGTADTNVFVNMMVCAGNARRQRDVFRVVYQLLWSGLQATEAVYSTLFRTCLSDGRVDLFWSVFASYVRTRYESLPVACTAQPNTRNYLQLAVVHSCGLSEAKVVLKKLGSLQGCVAPDAPLFEALFDRVVAGGSRHDLMTMAHCTTAALALEPDDDVPILFSRVSPATGDQLRPQALQARRVVVAGVLLKHGMYDEADAVLMKLDKPSVEQCELLLLQARDDSTALAKVLALLEKAGYKDRWLYSQVMLLRLVDSYAATGILVVAERVVAQGMLAEHATSGYASLLAGYARVGDAKGVESALRRLSACTLQPLHYGVMSALLEFYSSTDTADPPPDPPAGASTPRLFIPWTAELALLT